MTHTILGASGSIGTPLAKALQAEANNIRLVSRSPKAVNETDNLHPADLTDPSQVAAAVEGSHVVYITVGFEYKAEVWERVWPPFVKAVIEACAREKARLVMFDNMYMYAPDAVPHMTESSPIGPTSRKGKVRARLHNMLMEAHEKGQVEVAIARSADFIGQKNSLFNEMVLSRLKQGKKAQWFLSANHLHNFTYTEDAARATALIGTTPDAFGQVWHLPSTPPMTMQEYVTRIADILHTKPGIQVMPKPMISIASLFVPVLKEFREMLYQYDRDYVFDSSKFTKRFGLEATPVKEIIATMSGLQN